MRGFLWVAVLVLGLASFSWAEPTLQSSGISLHEKSLLAVEAKDWDVALGCAERGLAEKIGGDENIEYWRNVQLVALTKLGRLAEIQDRPEILEAFRPFYTDSEIAEIQTEECPGGVCSIQKGWRPCQRALLGENSTN